MKTYTTSEIAEILKIEHGAVNKLIRQGKLRATRVRDRQPWQVTQKALDDYRSKLAEGYLREV